MRRKVTNHTEVKRGSYSAPDKARKQWCNLSMHLKATRLTPGVHLEEKLPPFSPSYVVWRLWRAQFISVLPVWLFLDRLKYQGILDSSVSFLSLFARLLHLPPFDCVSKPLVCSVVYGWLIIGHGDASTYSAYSNVCMYMYACPFWPFRVVMTHSLTWTWRWVYSSLGVLLGLWKWLYNILCLWRSFLKSDKKKKKWPRWCHQVELCFGLRF